MEQTEKVNIRTQEEKEGKPALNLDTILIEDIGQFGKYQIRTIVLTIPLVILTSFCAMEYVFTTARIKTRCLIPECEDLETAVFAPSWIFNAVPAIDQCRRYDSANITTGGSACPAEWFMHNITVACSEFVYQNTHTIVYDYGLACDEWRRSLIGSVQTLGGIVALPITGFISDRWGRRFALSFNAFNAAWLGITRFWANTYFGFIISQGIEAVLAGGCFSCINILVMELVGPKYRVAAGAILITFVSVGQIILGAIAWAIPNWRHLTLTVYVPQLIFISYFWIMSESVRWYMTKGRYKEAEILLKKVAVINDRELSHKTVQILAQLGDEVQNKFKREENVKAPWLITLVFRHKEILKRCLITPIWWMTGPLIYYGMSINSLNMSGDPYINFIAVAASEIPGYWFAVLFMDRIGRRPVLISAYWTCAVCQLAYIFIPSNMYGSSLATYLIGKFSIAIVMMSLYIYTAEIFPTQYRHRLVAFSSMVGRIGSIVAPLTPAFGAAIGRNFPSALFCGFSFASGLLVFFVPETLATKLPDTMEEASLLGRKNTKTLSV